MNFAIKITERGGINGVAIFGVNLFCQNSWDLDC